ncbi:MAG: ATPase, T2SS/T4P/T4SS family [Pseudomonadota bacterium]
MFTKKAAMSKAVSAQRNDMPSPGAIGREDAREVRADVAAISERVVFRLWASGAANARAIEQARQEMDARTRLDQALVRLGLVDEVVAAKALAEEIGAPFAGESDYPACPIAMDLLPQRFVRESLALPISDDGELLRIAIADPLDDYVIRAIQLKTKRQVEVACAAPERLEREIARLYGAKEAGALRPAAKLDAETPEPQRAETSIAAATAPPAQQAALAKTKARPPAEPEALKAETLTPDRPRRPRPAPENAGARSAAPKASAKAFAEAPADAPGRPQARSPEPMTRSPEPMAPERDRAAGDSERPASEPSLAPVPFDAAAFAVSPPTPRFVRPKRVALKRPAERFIARLDEDPQPTGRRTRSASAAPRSAAPSDRSAARTKSAAQGGPDAEARPAPSTRSAIADGGLMLAFADAETERRAAASASKTKSEAKTRTESKSAPAASGRRPFDLMARFGAALATQVGRSTAKAEPESPSPDLAPEAPKPAAEPRRAKPMLEAFGEAQDFSAARGGAAVSLEKPRESAPEPATAERIERDRSADPAAEPTAKAKPQPPRRARPNESEEARRTERALERARAEARRIAPEPAPAPKPAATYAPNPAATPERTLRTKASDRAKARDFVVAEVRKKLREAIAPTAMSGGLKVALRAAEDSARGGAEDRRATLVGPSATPEEIDLAALGFDAASEAVIAQALDAQDGMIAVCGLAGSGKVATRNALAARLAAAGVAVRPLETVGAGERRRSDKTGARRAAVGAIRSADDAEAAARAAMTGWLVIVTLETPTAASAAPHLVRTGVPPYVLASSLRAAVSQRAVSEEEAAAIGARGEAIGGAVTAVHAVAFDDAMRALILAQADEATFCQTMGVPLPREPEPMRPSGPPRPLTAGVRAP